MPVSNSVPRYAYRGLLLDCVRHYFPVAEIKRVIQQMALVRLNAFHWVLTNDHGWRIESRAFPRLNQAGGAYYTREEIREIVAFAAQRGIEVIPEIDMPGHMTALLAAYPEYSCFGKPVTLAKTGGIYPVILCAGQEKTYAMLEKLLDEILPLFPGKHVHLGGDEAPKREWKACPHCQQTMRENHLDNEDALEGYFLSRVIEMAAVRGKEAICWNDALMGNHLDSRAVIQYWTVNHAEETKCFLQKGGKVIYSDMFSYYLDYPHICTPLQRVYTDVPVLDDLPVADQIAGVECCLWTEHIATNEQLERHLFPRLYAFGEMAWNGSVDYAEFRKRLPAFLAAHHPQDMACTPPEEWDADMPDRTAKVLGYMQHITDSMSEEARATVLETSAPTLAFQKRFAKCFLGR